MLVELAIGDAYGAGFEYADPEIVRTENTLLGYRKHPLHDLPAGSYTDDTQMTLAIAEAIVERDPWTPESLAARFLDAFHRDPRPGYARRFHAFLTDTHDATLFLSNMIATSDRSGAAMRSAPIGLFASVEEVLERTAIQAKLTHDTPDGIHAAQAAALAVHYVNEARGPRSALGDFLCEHIPGDWDVPWSGPIGEKGWMSVRAAITAATQQNRLSDMLKASVSFTGDVDTVATIAMAIGSVSDDVVQDIPSLLKAGLENGPYGRDYLENLDTRLFECRSALTKER